MDDTGADDVVLPALLRASRGAYGHAIRRRLAGAGIDDLPRNGPYVIGGMANHGGSAGQLVGELGISAAAAALLLDALVLRGYLDRGPDPDDARRIRFTVTARGRAAATAVAAGVAEVDAQLAELITPAEYGGLRAGLMALCDIRDRYEEAREASAL